ncbi:MULTISPECIES: Bug family tripartite tricarboxylate transporter substrate binding protein [Cupriavidus]|uniref:Tripartite tricarboxylate transporter substrate binding protein n=1 Tax=Cupriavidus pauculus TaxID=82633 RepID=A0A5P2HA65_9BURK|nr:tripartite tricarboxylate transporter substrate binding protein [Cupriavidus pauculus]QET04333.1 tripartite tricarboxylate transporter substrate binding protein [Cupriavidus pauculus]
MTFSASRRALAGLVPAVALTALTALPAPRAFAQKYPDKPVTMVVGSAPGGFTDVLGRLVGQQLSEKLGQPVVIDNRAGASTTIGTQIVTKAEPDGYTLLMGHFAGVSVAPAMMARLSYDPIRDLTPIARVASTPVILTVGPSIQARTLKDLIEYLRKHPGKVTYASSGIGTAQHLAAVQFMRATDTEMVHVPYKGSSQGMTDLLGGRVDLNFESPPNVLQHIKAGKLHGIAITSLKRSPLLPDVPTMDESGLPKFEMSQWFGVMGPAKMQRAQVEMLNRDINAILARPEVAEKIQSMGGDVLGGTADQFAAFQKADAAHWARLLREAGIKPE